MFIVDDVAFIKPEHGHAIAAELEKRRVRKKYYLETRSDVLLRNEEVFRRWRRLGLDYMFLGMEAMDEGGLEAYRKRVRSTTAQNLTTLDYRLFDIQHAVLPTTLPLPVFYAELVKTQAVINRKHLGVAGLAQTAGIATRLLLRGQTNFVRMLWRFSSVYNGDRQLADHQRPVRYELPPPSPDAITPGRRELYVHEIRGRGDRAGAIVPAPSDPA